jgi:TPP-dependent pyruvate/acetoin dehydrogenase alpha subunit
MNRELGELRRFAEARVKEALGVLVDPSQLHSPLDISECDGDRLLGQLKLMLTIRKAEEQIGDMVTAGKIKCPCHLAIGQEAIAVGVSSHLSSSDHVFGTHRSHAHYLAQGGDLYALFAETLGRVTGCSRGMGGSMHLYGGDFGFVGSVPIVAGTIPLAVGAGLAAKMDDCGDVAVAYFGDGATEEGSFQESLNVASVMGLPVVFVCENNLFSSHMYIGLRQPSGSTARFAKAHRIPAKVIDGNDVVAVTKAAGKAVCRARAGNGPSFIEAITYRWRGHVGSREDIDVGLKRSNSDLVLWKERDPIRRLVAALQNANLLSSGEFSALRDKVQELVLDVWARAEQAPYPEESILLDAVYFDKDKTV